MSIGAMGERWVAALVCLLSLLGCSPSILPVSSSAPALDALPGLVPRDQIVAQETFNSPFNLVWLAAQQALWQMSFAIKRWEVDGTRGRLFASADGLVFSVAVVALEPGAIQVKVRASPGSSQKREIPAHEILQQISRILNGGEGGR